MKIFIPLAIQKNTGPSVFALKLSEDLRKMGHQVIFNFEKDFDALLLIISGPLKYIYYAKKNKIPIIQRLDGVYYWANAKYKFPLKNLKTQIIHNWLADFIIYQSDYSRQLCQKFYLKKRKEHKVIINGVDLKIFNPEGEKISFSKKENEKIIFSASLFRRKDQIEPILKSLKILREKRNDFKLILAGKFIKGAEQYISEIEKTDWIEYLGEIENKKLPLYERAADLFLFTHLNPPCPNNVIEAIACGLPICGIKSGAMKELIENKKNGLLLDFPYDCFMKNEEINCPAFANQIGLLMDNLTFYKKNVLISRENFSLRKMSSDYLGVLKSCQKKRF